MYYNFIFSSNNEIKKTRIVALLSDYFEVKDKKIILILNICNG